METMGERLKRLRYEHNLTQEYVGKILGVQKAAINKYENGDVENIKRTSILKLAQLYNVSPSYILCFDDIVDDETIHDDSISLLTDRRREEYIKKEIKNHGYNLKDFATKIGMPYTTLLSIVNKSVGGAALDNIIKICNGLDLNIEILNPYIDHNTIHYIGLNDVGIQKVKDYIEDLKNNPRYSNKNLDTDDEEYELIPVAARDGGITMHKMPKEIDEETLKNHPELKEPPPEKPF